VHASLIAQMGRLMNKSAQLRGGLEQSAAEHRAILAAIDAGDSTLAARLLEEHIEVPQRMLALADAHAIFEDDDQDDADQPRDEEWRANG